MNLLTVPGIYENAPGSVRFVGTITAEIGRKQALVVAGERAFESVREQLTGSLAAVHIQYEHFIFKGYPTVEAVEKITSLIRSLKADVLIAAGGGRVLDAGKLAAYYAEIPVITIPTIPATCAAFTTLSVLYNSDGQQTEYRYRDTAPEVVIADREVLNSAPTRYFYAGIADSVVKKYEIATNYNSGENDFAMRLQIKICDLLNEFLEDDFWGELAGGAVSETVKNNALDGIIMLAGLAGCIKGKISYGGLAHHFYNQYTQFQIPDRRMHGEAVIWGLIVQFVTESRDEDFIKNYLRKLKIIGQPLTLADLGIVSDTERVVTGIAGLISAKVGKGLTPEIMTKAINTADCLGGEIAREEIRS